MTTLFSLSQCCAPILTGPCLLALGGAEFGICYSLVGHPQHLYCTQFRVHGHACLNCNGFKFSHHNSATIEHLNSSFVHALTRIRISLGGM